MRQKIAPRRPRTVPISQLLLPGQRGAVALKQTCLQHSQSDGLSEWTLAPAWHNAAGSLGPFDTLALP